MKRAVVYTRISRDPDHTELGVKRQAKDCLALCERDGLEVVEVVTDDDQSAYRGKRRPGFERVMQMVRDGEVSVIVAWHPDRITRNPREMEDVIDLLEATKATVRTVQAGEYDLATPSGRTVARIIGNVARGESEHKSARLRRKHQELAERGLNSGGGTRPFGFEQDRLTLRPSEVELIVQAVADVLDGATIRSIAQRWTNEGVKSPRNKAWSPTVVRNMLISGRIAGLREHSTGTYPAVWPPMITADDHRRIVALLTDPARRKNGRPVRYPLTGFLVCGLCGTKLVARPRGDGRRCYVCAGGPGFHGCGKIRTLSEPLEELVISAVLKRYDTPELAATVERTTDDTPAEMPDLERIEAQLAELAEMWAAGELDRVSWAAARRPLEDARSAAADLIRSQAATTTINRVVRSGVMREQWPDLDIDERRAVIGSVVESIAIGPAVKGRNFFDPSRVSVKWIA